METVAESLKRHHQRLLEAAARAMSIIAGSFAEADLAALGRLRDDMVGALAAYQSYVHREILEAANEGGDAAARGAAQDLKIGCILLAADYQAFRSRWVHRQVGDHWPEYRLSARRMNRRVQSHIEQAEALYPG